MTRDYRLFIEDVLDAIGKIEEFIGNMECCERKVATIKNPGRTGIERHG